MEGIGALSWINRKRSRVANTSVLAKFISPKTGFIHIDIDDGLLDISLYKESKDTIELLFGMGFTLEITKSLPENGYWEIAKNF